MSLIRKIIGFIPALNPAMLAWIIMSPAPATSEVYRTPLYRPDDVPWFVWLWLLAAVVSGVLLCMKKTIPAGLVVGIIPHIVLAVCALSTYFEIAVASALGAMILFYVIYALCYYTYHRELNKP